MVNNEKLPNLEQIDSSDSFEDSEDEYETEGEDLTKCLFCENAFKETMRAVEHLKSVHLFDLHLLKAKFSMDQYQFIKMINYVRTEKDATPENICSTEIPPWNDDKYLKPKEYESWLSFDFEELIKIRSSGSDNKKNSAEKVIARLLENLKEKDSLLEQAYKDIEKMKASYKRLMDEDNNGLEEKGNSVSSISPKADQSYFSSYDHYGIHHEMLSDVVRTESYRDAFIKNSDFITGKTVLDVGCGTSILSMFAAKAGAKEVISIDNSDIIYNAMDIVKKNNISNISFVKGRLEDTALPIEKFDVIVSEWMGYFLFFEGMLDSVIYAREKHLKPGGTLLPNRCNISLMGHGDIKFYNKYVKFWNDVYGFNMSNMLKEILKEPVIEVCDPEQVLTEPTIIAEYNLNTVDLSYSNFSFNFKLKCVKGGSLTSFLGYFDIFFDLQNRVEFSTSPLHTPTHWKQVVFLLDKPVEVKTNEIIDGKIVCRRSKNCLRSLDINISVFNKEYKYFLD